MERQERKFYLFYLSTEIFHDSFSRETVNGSNGKWGTVVFSTLFMQFLFKYNRKISRLSWLFLYVRLLSLWINVRQTSIRIFKSVLFHPSVDLERLLLNLVMSRYFIISTHHSECVFCNIKSHFQADELEQEVKKISSKLIGPEAKVAVCSLRVSGLHVSAE